MFNYLLYNVKKNKIHSTPSLRSSVPSIMHLKSSQ